MRIYVYLFIVAGSLLLHACTQDEKIEETPTGMSKITLSIDRQKQAVVRGVEDDPQSIISNVHFLLFDGLTCVKHIYVEDGNSTQVEIDNGEYTCYAITNTGQSDLFSEKTTISDLEESFSYVLPKKDYWETGDPLPAFVMGGKKEIFINASGVRHEIPVYRVCSKIDVTINVNTTDGNLEKYNYQIRDISLEGLPMKSTYCFNDGLRPGDDDFNFRVFPFSEENGVIKLSFYMLENLAGGRLAEEDVSAGMKEKYPKIYDSDDQAGKRKYAPAHAAHLTIKGHAINQYGDDIYTTHYVYLGHNAANDYNVGRNEHHAYTVNIKGINELDIDTRVEATLTPPEFSDLDPSNCFVVSTTGNYYIPATFMGNRKDKPLSEIMGNIDESTLAAEFLWTDNKESIWLETIEYADDPNDPEQKIIKFRVKGNPQLNIEDRGNTVIALYGYDKTDVNHENPIILWSWHIWLTDKPKEVVIGGKVQGTTQNNIKYPGSDGTLIVMDRNLGATSGNPNEGGMWRTYGCHYQMGRKDPFPNAKIEGEWFNYTNSSYYDQKSIGAGDIITHLKYNETAPFADFNNDSRCAFNEKLAPDKVIGFKYLQEGISGLYGARNPMVFATKFQEEDTRWTDRAINELEGDPLYDVTGARQDYWNRQKTIHDPCPSGWTILGDAGSFWNQGSQLEQFSYSGFKDRNGRYLGGIYSQLPGYSDKVWWPAAGVRSVYGRLSNMGHTSVYYMFDHIDHPHGAHVARFLLNTEINASNVAKTFTIQGKEYAASGTYNGLLSQVNVGGNSSGTNQASSVRCVKVDQDLNNLNKTNTRSGLVKIN